MGLIEESWMPECVMKRVICHWTAGTHTASEFDREHYHILIEKDGKLVRGVRSIADNVSTHDDVYAAHTKRCNTRSIGVSVCCMASAAHKPFNAGKFPMTKTQWNTLAKVTAELCDRYGIEVTPKTVLGHGEVQKNLEIAQDDKWDPMVLPWDPSLTIAQVGSELRNKVKGHVTGTPAPDPEPPPAINVKARGKKIDGAFIQDGIAFAMVRPVSDAMGWTIQSTTLNRVTLVVGAKTFVVPMLTVNGRGFVGCREVAEETGTPIGWDAATRTVSLG